MSLVRYIFIDPKTRREYPIKNYISAEAVTAIALSEYYQGVMGNAAAESRLSSITGYFLRFSTVVSDFVFCSSIKISNPKGGFFGTGNMQYPRVELGEIVKHIDTEGHFDLATYNAANTIKLNEAIANSIQELIDRIPEIRQSLHERSAIAAARFAAQEAAGNSNSFHHHPRQASSSSAGARAAEAVVEIALMAPLMLLHG